MITLMHPEIPTDILKPDDETRRSQKTGRPNTSCVTRPVQAGLTGGGTGTVVMAKRLGARVSLIRGITIGARATSASPLPRCGVFVGAGARILGDTAVGGGVDSGVNAVVLKNVPSGAATVGVPARVLAENPAAGGDSPSGR